MKLSMFDATTKQDLNIAPEPVFLPTTVIADREILHDNLEKAGHTAEWLEGDSLLVNQYN